MKFFSIVRFWQPVDDSLFLANKNEQWKMSVHQKMVGEKKSYCESLHQFLFCFVQKMFLLFDSIKAGKIQSELGRFSHATVLESMSIAELAYSLTHAHEHVAARFAFFV